MVNKYNSSTSGTILTNDDHDMMFVSWGAHSVVDHSQRLQQRFSHCYGIAALSVPTHFVHKYLTIYIGLPYNDHLFITDLYYKTVNTLCNVTK